MAFAAIFCLPGLNMLTIGVFYVMTGRNGGESKTMEEVHDHPAGDTASPGTAASSSNAAAAEAAAAEAAAAEAAGAAAAHPRLCCADRGLLQVTSFVGAVFSDTLLRAEVLARVASSGR